MDALSMDFAHNQFDLLCDLSILDTCYLSRESEIRIRDLLGEVHRVLQVSLTLQNCGATECSLTCCCWLPGRWPSFVFDDSGTRRDV